MKHTLHLFSSLAVSYALFLTSCGGGGGEADQTTGSSGGEKVLSGVLLAPDGETPVAGATVYVPSDSSTGSLSASATLNCEPPQESYVTYTCTEPDGSFSLVISGLSGTITIKFKKGSFQKTMEVNLDSLSDNIEIGNVNLPSKPGQGAPKIAVVTGNYDKMGNVLTKLNVSFDLYDGNYSLDDTNYKNFPYIFNDNDGDSKPDIYNYDIVFINCGNEYEYDILNDQTKKSILRDYVLNGGKLYVTDLSYDFVEQVFPEYIDFYGSDNTPENEPEDMGSAEVGKGGITTNAEILDSTLKGWLKNVSCVNSNGNSIPCIDPNTEKVHIEGFLVGWVVMNGPHSQKANDVKVWVSGDVSWYGETGTETGTKLLTITFNFGEGKVLYTSYHTEPYSSPSSGFLPQERILQYLVFF